MKGILTYWGHDIKSAKDSLSRIGEITVHLKVHQLIKDDIMGDLDKISRILNKGIQRDT